METFQDSKLPDFFKDALKKCSSKNAALKRNTKSVFTRCEHRGRDETPGGPNESKWTKSWHTYVGICVQSTHVYKYAGR